MRIASGVTDQYIYFVGVDATDFTTRETGLSSFTVYRSRNGGAAAAMTTPTINETDTTNMPGVYELLLDEDMTIDAGDDTQEMVFHITHAGMAPVTRTIELYRPKITAGNTLGVASDGDISGNLDGTVATVTTLTGHTAQTGDSFARIGATGSGLTSLAQASAYTATRAGYLDNINNAALQTTAAQTGDSFARLGAPAGVSVSADIATVDSNVDAILVDTADMQPKLGTVTDLGGGATIGANLSNMAGATFSAATDSQEAIRDRGDAAWTTGAGTGLTALASGTAQGGTSTTIQLAAGESFGDNILNGNVVKITSGTGAGQARVITAYTGATDTATVTPAWATNPAADSVYEVVEGHVNLAAISLDGTAADNAESFFDGTGYDATANTINLSAASEAQIDAIETDTNELQGDWTNTGRLDTILDTIAADVVNLDGAAMRGTDSAATAAALATAQADLDLLTGTDGATLATSQPNYAPNTTTPPTAAAIADAVWDEPKADHTTSTTFGDLATDLDSTLADTNELQGDWTNGGRLDLILDELTTNVDAVETDTQDIQSRLPAALVTGRMSSDAVAISGSTAAADNLEASAEVIVTGTAQTGTLSTTVMTSNLTEATDDHYIGRIIIWTSGALLGQATDITDYSGTNGTLTYTAVTEAPSNGDTFVIV